MGPSQQLSHSCAAGAACNLPSLVGFGLAEGDQAGVEGLTPSHFERSSHHCQSLLGGNGLTVQCLERFFLRLREVVAQLWQPLRLGQASTTWNWLPKKLLFFLAVAPAVANAPLPPAAAAAAAPAAAPAAPAAPAAAHAAAPAATPPTLSAPPTPSTPPKPHAPKTTREALTALGIVVA